MADEITPPSIADDRTAALATLMQRLDTLPVDAIIGQLYDPDLCPAEALPFLARQFGVYDAHAWALAGTEEARRGLVKRALALQAKRGTPWALKQALAAIGWPGMEVQERTSDWWKFRVTQPIGARGLSADDLGRLLPVIQAWAPARCELDAVELGVAFESNVSGTGPKHDGTYAHDGAIKYEGLVLDTIAKVAVGHGAASLTLAAAPTVDKSTPGKIIVSFNVGTADANGMSLDTFAVLTAVDTVIATATAPAVAKTAAVSLACTWTLNVI